jgi:hypothetical protein
VVVDNGPSLAVAHRLGAVEIRTEPSDGGSTYVVFELTLPLD